MNFYRGRDVLPPAVQTKTTLLHSNAHFNLFAFGLEFIKVHRGAHSERCIVPNVIAQKE